VERCGAQRAVRAASVEVDPSWYLLGTEDKAIPPATQRFMAERATSTIEEVPASHASMVSQPHVTTELIVTAANATVGTTA
jgi:pimeloyl-ACP methyl ester carboxylesterase